MGAIEQKTIKLQPYLDVLAQLPGVSQQDIEKTREIFTDAFGKFPNEVTFHRGLWSGDGRIQVNQIYRSEGGSDVTSQLVFKDNGWVENPTTGFSDKLPSSLAIYFFGGIFGIDEISQKPTDKSEVLLIEGVMAFYECAKQKGAANCANSEGAKKIAEAKKLMDENATMSSLRSEISKLEKEYKEAAAKVNSQANLKVQVASLDAMMPEEIKSPEQAKLAVKLLHQKVEIAHLIADEEQKTTSAADYNAKADAIWNEAKVMKEKAKGIGAGNPDAIQKAMDSYEAYHFAGGSTDLGKAQKRYEKALEMMQVIAADKGGWPQFKERHCGKGSFLKEKDCGQHYSGSCDVYTLVCDFGVSTNEKVYDCNCFHNEPTEHGK